MIRNKNVKITKCKSINLIMFIDRLVQPLI